MNTIIHSDGATLGQNSRRTLTEVGLGVYIPSIRKGFYQRVNGISNNEAEFKALQLAMAIARHLKARHVTFKLDSRIVVNRANGRRPKGKWRNDRMDAFQDDIMVRKQWFTSTEFIWVPRERNTEADDCSKLACRMLDKASATVKVVTIGNINL